MAKKSPPPSRKQDTQSKHRRGRKSLYHYIPDMRARLLATERGKNIPAIGVRQNISLDQLVKVVQTALRNQVQLPIEAKAFSAAKPGQRAAFLQGFVQPGNITEPCVFVDRNQTALIWYLPAVIPNAIQLQAFRAAEFVASKLKSSGNSVASHWRSNGKYDASQASANIPVGSDTFSSGWLAQGHTSSRFPLKSSRNLRKPETAEWANTQWLQSIKGMDSCVNLLLALLDAPLFEVGREVLAALRRDPETTTWSKRWTSVYTAICLVANRVTPPHRDTKGCPRFLDALVNTGTCVGAVLRLPELGAVFGYGPGTVIAFSGRDFFHEVPPWTSGERVCYAYFMREEVLRRFVEKEELKQIGWSKVQSM